MRALRRRIRQLADVPSTVLVTGETGTGKSEVARALHLASCRRGAPFVVADCASLSASLLESELFGHEAGAFTGARSLRRGRLEIAERGTVLLDEIGELPRSLQAKLLRVLEERAFERVGGTRRLVLRARVVAATNVDLAASLRIGSFRPDLYYRLNVVRLRIPPLRERREDLPELARHLMGQLSSRLGRPAPEMSDSFLEALVRHSWPGNARELRNVLERLLVEFPCGRLEERQLEAILGEDRALAGGSAPSAPASLAEPERIARVLQETGGNVARAARRLGLARSTLRRRIERYALRSLLPRD